MIRPKTHWIVAVEDVETAEIGYIMDRYNHRPQQFFAYADAVRAVSQFNRRRENVGAQRAHIVEQCDKPKETELVRG